jgi:hypothetical protein
MRTRAAEIKDWSRFGPEGYQKVCTANYGIEYEYP